MTPKTHEETAKKLLMSYRRFDRKGQGEYIYGWKEGIDKVVAKALRDAQSSLASDVMGVLPEKDGGDRVGFYDLRAQGFNEARQAVLNLFTSRGITLT